jgi:hypothetical protein
MSLPHPRGLVAAGGEQVLAVMCRSQLAENARHLRALSLLDTRHLDRRPGYHGIAMGTEAVQRKATIRTMGSSGGAPRPPSGGRALCDAITSDDAALARYCPLRHQSNASRSGHNRACGQFCSG